MEQFSCKTKILSGVGALDALKDLGIRRLFVVADPFFVKNGVARQVATMTGAEETEFFDKVQPDPSVTLAAEGTGELKAFGPDTVLALGGGSAMDCAKAMVFFAGLGCRLVAVPTTSGSGSEVTDFSILTHDGVKHPLVEESIRPDVAVLDGSLLEKLPPGLIADTGFDVLSHALEAYVATGAGAITDALARDAFATAFSLLPSSFSGVTAVRQQIHEAATMAGMAFTQAGLGLCHAMAHSLGGALHLPHGRLNAILLPAVIRFNAPAAGAKYARMARAAGIGGSAETVAVRNLQNALVKLRREMGMPDTLRQAGADREILRRNRQQILSAALEDPCCRTNPRAVDLAAVGQIFDEVSGLG